MKTTAFSVLLCAAAFDLASWQAAALPIELTTPGGTYKFSEFSVGGELAGKASEVNAVLIGDGSAANPFGIRFTGPFGAQSPQTVADFSISYKVEKSGGDLITSIEQGFSQSGIGIGNTMTTLEQVWRDGVGSGLLASSALSFPDVSDADPNWWQSEQLLLSEARSAVWVTKDIHLALGNVAEGQTAPVQITVEVIAQRFPHANVPDPSGTAPLLTLGVACLGFLRARSRR